MSQSPRKYLLVEGNSDLQFIENLCLKHGLAKPAIKMPVRGGGITQLIESVPDRVNEPQLSALGIVVDADTNIAARWQALGDRLQDKEKLQELVYTSFPSSPVIGGWVSSEFHSPKVGIGLMPDNIRPGMLEDFARDMIPAADQLLTKVDSILQEIEAEELHRYTKAERPKAFIHTWLAWQREPGRPLGQVIAHNALHHNTPLADTFVTWLRRLFDLPAAEVA